MNRPAKDHPEAIRSAAVLEDTMAQTIASGGDLRAFASAHLAHALRLYVTMHGAGRAAIILDLMRARYSGHDDTPSGACGPRGRA